ncbi:MAG: DoxX family membrane protein [Leptolyngbyaceae cyanobacterium bins.302]|nr:DoxX family membrane protein [Leptolyngbyaceae cyanobacterium bins.302]
MANPQPIAGLWRKDVATAYVLLRILFGIAFFIIGVNKIRGLGGFANAMVEMFKNTFLPAELVRITALVVAPLEVIVGLLLLLGLFTRGALVAGFILMLILHAGVTLLQDWKTASNQLVYCIIFFLLLAGAGFNAFSIDQWLARKRVESSPPDNLPSDIVSFVQRRFGNLFGRKRSRRRLIPATTARR